MISIHMLHSKYHYNLEVRYVLDPKIFFDTIYGTNLDNFMMEWLRGRALQPVDNMLSFPSDEYDEDLFKIVPLVKSRFNLFAKARAALSEGAFKADVIELLGTEAVKRKMMG